MPTVSSDGRVGEREAENSTIAKRKGGKKKNDKKKRLEKREGEREKEREREGAKERMV